MTPSPEPGRGEVRWEKKERVCPRLGRCEAMCDHAGLGVRSCVVAWSANVCCIPTIPLSRARLPRPPGRYKADQAFLVGQDKSPVGAYLDVEVSAAAVAASVGLGWVGLGRKERYTHG